MPWPWSRSELAPNTNTGNPNVNQPFPAGLEEWVPCVDAVVDICFVHGLTGNRNTTWTARKQEEPWPKKLLPQALPNLKARILTYGYDAYPIALGARSLNKLTGHANHFLQRLTANRARIGAEDRPLIIIAHSLGGLVTKAAVLKSRDTLESGEAHLSKVYSSLLGIIFMGTPHTGSWLADWGKPVAQALGVWISANTDLLRILQTTDELLEDHNDKFRRMWDTQNRIKADSALRVTCFYEELEIPRIGPIVPQASATFAGHTPISIHANHMDMVKFASLNDDGFENVVAELLRWTKRDTLDAFNNARQGQLDQRPSENDRVTAHRRPSLREEPSERTSSVPPSMYTVQGNARVQFGDHYEIGDRHEYYNNVAYASNHEEPAQVPRSAAGADILPGISGRAYTLDDNTMPGILETRGRSSNTFITHGGHQFNNTGDGTQYNNTGSGSQVNVTDGNHTFNFGNNQG